MKFLKSEAGAIVLWVAASLLCAGILAPHFYTGGKALIPALTPAPDADAQNLSVLGDIGTSLAGSLERAKLDRYFSRALLVSALLLLPALIYRVKSLGNTTQSRFRLQKITWPARIYQLLIGIVIGAACLGLLGLVLAFFNASTPDPSPLSPEKILSKALLPALGAGIIEEIIFRGLILGLWLRACSLWTACIGSSVLFSFLHFIKPPKGMQIDDPTAWTSGFEILGATLHHFTEPTFFVTEFATLTFLGLILALCRVGTRSLWLPIGLHAGLVFSLKVFAMTQDLVRESFLNPWWIGNDLKTGILPLLALGLCGTISITLSKTVLSPPKHSQI